MLAASEGALLLVEGKRDVEAIRNLGLGEAMSINQGKSLVQLADEIGTRRVELLMDWDRTGEERQRRLRGIILNNDDCLRRHLKDWAATRCVEFIPRELKQLRDLAPRF
jgi:5S rRNA maturation endonuclease (ribonuclease M5)